MNKVYYFVQVFAIAMLCSCTAKTENVQTVDARLYDVATTNTFTDVVSDTDTAQLAMCERVLNECAKYGVLDAKGVQVYNRLKPKKSVSAYIELITECEREENFYDTIGSGDEWCNYVWHVLEPRGLAE